MILFQKESLFLLVVKWDASSCNIRVLQFHQDFGAMKKTKKAILNNRQRQNKKSDVEKAKDQIREIAARIDNEEEFVLPEDDMISTDDENDEELSSMAFLDGLSQSKQIEKLEKERKRRINNQGEEFEIEKRRFV